LPLDPMGGAGRDHGIFRFEPSKLCAEHDEQPYRRGARYCRRPAPVSENRHLAEEVALSNFREIVRVRVTKERNICEIDDARHSATLIRCVTYVEPVTTLSPA